MAPVVRGFDPDAPDGASGEPWPAASDPWGEGRDDWAGEGSRGWAADDAEAAAAAAAEAGVWVDPFDEVGAEEHWVDPVEDVTLDTPAARADWAYGKAVDPATPAELLTKVAIDLAQWDVDALLAEAAMMGGGLDERPDPPPGDRPDVMVLRSLLKHPNRPDDLADAIVGTWLEDPTERSVWPTLVAMAQDAPLDDDLLVTAVSEACDVARAEAPSPPAWSLLLVALSAVRPGGAAARDLLAMAPFPHDDPTRVWPDADTAAKGLPGGTRARAKAGAERLGWDGVRHPGLVDAVVAEVHRLDEQARRASFADSITLCPHGPVLVTPSAVSLPATARGEKPYVARIVGSHPVFRLKRDWPDRDDGATGTAWTWAGAEVLEARDLGCDGCCNDPDNGKRYFVTDGELVAPLRLRTLRRVLDDLDAGGDGSAGASVS